MGTKLKVASKQCGGFGQVTGPPALAYYTPTSWDTCPALLAPLSQGLYEIAHLQIGVGNLPKYLSRHLKFGPLKPFH